MLILSIGISKFQAVLCIKDMLASKCVAIVLWGFLRIFIRFVVGFRRKTLAEMSIPTIMNVYLLRTLETLSLPADTKLPLRRESSSRSFQNQRSG
jgi:hypothetical protein